VDLVHLQLHVASGDPLPFRQDDVRASGHAIECRVYAEDSATLLPQSGRLLRYREPRGPGAHGVRVDGGVREGQTIGVHYDPLLAKVITHADTREAALLRMTEAIHRFEILGLRHNLPFLLRLLAMPEVQSSRTYTTLIEDHLEDITRAPATPLRQAAVALAAAVAMRGPSLAVTQDGAAFDPWTTLGPVSW
jgi:acetyl-CoA/propionyl-CoA carboxylase biotin carboxyl carrier protein